MTSFRFPRSAARGATACCALAAALAGGWMAGGPTGLLVAAVVAAVAAMAVVRVAYVPAPMPELPLPHGGVPVADAPFRRYRKLSNALSWGQVSRRHFDHTTRPELERLAAALISARCGVDPLSRPDAARALLGDDLWALAEPGRPRSDDSFAPAVPLATVARLIDRLEDL